MSEIKELTALVNKFIADRDWNQFHNPKDMAISLALESAEVLEHFQWKSPEEIKAHLKDHQEDVADELADVLYWALVMAHHFDIDLAQALRNKLVKNAAKYPVDKAKGKHTKYTDL